MQAWKVWLKTRDKRLWIDTVYFDKKMTAAEVAVSLINHDGYPTSIVVEKET